MHDSCDVTWRVAYALGPVEVNLYLALATRAKSSQREVSGKQVKNHRTELSKKLYFH